MGSVAWTEAFQRYLSDAKLHIKPLESACQGADASQEDVKAIFNFLDFAKTTFKEVEKSAGDLKIPNDVSVKIVVPGNPGVVNSNGLQIEKTEVTTSLKEHVTTGTASKQTSEDYLHFESVLPSRSPGNTQNGVNRRVDRSSSTPGFVIDTNPTPVNLSGISSRHQKRQRDGPLEPAGKAKNRSKKAKTEHKAVKISGEEEIEREDITEMVNERLKEKEKRRQATDTGSKKRKRESLDSQASEELPPRVDEEPAAERTKKPEKKRRKQQRKADRAAKKEAEAKSGKVKKPKKKKKYKNKFEKQRDREAQAQARAKAGGQ